MRSYSENNYDLKQLEPIPQLYKYTTDHLSEHLIGFYLHGSFSTLDPVEYSDLDTLMIVKKSVVNDPEKLYELREII